MSKATHHYENIDYQGEIYYVESIRYEEVIGDQIYRIEFDLMDETWTWDNLEMTRGHWEHTWNIVQGVYERGADFYAIDESKSTGRTPMATYGAALRGLKACISFLREEYDMDDSHTHTLCAGWADEKRHRVYERVLGKMGWVLGVDNDDPCMKLVITN